MPTKNISDEFELHEHVQDKERLVALASGPSANKCNLDKNSLYITTNSSYLILNKDISFIHIIKDLGYLYKFLIFGLKFKPLAVIIDVNTHSNGQGFGSKSVKLLNKYFGKVKYDYPVVITDNENILKLNKKDYRNEMTSFFTHNDIVRHGSNSGELIYSYGVWLSAVNNIAKFDVYGIDAGEGGNKHFDGRTTANNHVAFRDENKSKMGEFFDQCQNKYSHIINHSYFKNNEK